MNKRQAILAEPLEDRTLFSNFQLLGIDTYLQDPTIPTIQAQDFVPQDTQLNYNATTQTLTIDATPTTFKQNANAPASFFQSPSDYKIVLSVNNAGELNTSTPADFYLTGTVDANGNGTIDAGESGVLLTGQIIAFGAANSPTTSTDEFDFRFGVTGGGLQSYFAGKDIGVDIDAVSSSFNDTFATNFHSNVQAVTGPVPKVGNSSLSGLVYNDVNNNGQVDLGEVGIAGATVKLSGTDTVNNLPVNLTTTTDANGMYVFDNLFAGNYTIVETQPAGYADGKDTVGTSGDLNNTESPGAIHPAGTDSFNTIVLPDNTDGLNYNFGELAQQGTPLGSGQTATIGFWHNKNGQALIKSLNGSPNSTALGNWLATTLPNIFGPTTGSNNTTGMTNTQVAKFYLDTRFNAKGQKLDAQLMSIALAAYSTSSALSGGSVASSYGFTVSSQGTGAATFNVGSNGAAFGFANNSTHSVMDYLLAANNFAYKGLLWDINDNGSINSSEQSLRDMANNLFTAINETGDIS